MMTGPLQMKALLANLGHPTQKFISPTVINDGTSSPSKVDVLAILKQLSQRKLSEQQILTHVLSDN
jgi:hypothetical protein